jgi:8-oxo-dGTP diphosphatase
MLRDLAGTIWRGAPTFVRRWSMRLAHARFTVTAAGIVIDDNGRVLLLKHRFRGGSGWGIPGGFVEAGEQAEEGLRRELREEIGLELDSAEICKARTFSDVRQIEIVFRCRSQGIALPQSIEIRKAGWFPLSELPDGLPESQRQLIKQVLNDGAKS